MNPWIVREPINPSLTACILESLSWAQIERHSREMQKVQDAHARENLKRTEEGLEPKTSDFEARSLVFAVAIGVDRWEGEAAPDAKAWPPLDDLESFETRLAFAADLPFATVIAPLAGTIIGRFGLTEDEEKNSEPQSESLETPSPDTKGASSAVAAEKTSDGLEDAASTPPP